MFGENKVRNRSIAKLFYVNDVENRKIKEKMREVGLENFSTFARTMLVFGEVKFINFDELREFRREVSRVGNNVNQIARKANLENEVTREQIIEVLTVLKELKKNMGEMLTIVEKNAMKKKC